MQISCETAQCTRKGYWIEVAENGEPLFCFRTRHNGENHSVRMTIGQIVVASMPHLMGRPPDKLEVEAIYFN